jgi:DNA invertase Pin-like site-specific DNA recombinase
MGDAPRHKFEQVLVWKLDRWGRDIAHCFTSIGELAMLKIGWSAVNQPGVDTSTPGVMDTVYALCAFLSTQKRERIQASMRLAKRRDSIGRPRKFLDREKVYAMRDAGASIRSIAAELRVGYGTVQQILRDRQR